MKTIIATLIATLFASLSILLTISTAQAVNECSVECRGAPEDGYDKCISDCEARQTGSIELPTMVADGADAPKTTQFAQLRIGDPKATCGTDAWACFHGADDESPLIRDVGIFGVFAWDDPDQSDPWGSGEGSGM